MISQKKSRCNQAAFQRSDYYRFENCLRLLALRKPTFLRSTSRASRVTYPALDRSGLSSASKSINALVIPCLTAPACPDSPPPETFTLISKVVSFFVKSKGCLKIISDVKREKYLSTGIPLIRISPLPCCINTRATELFLLPVPY